MLVINYRFFFNIGVVSYSFGVDGSLVFGSGVVGEVCSVIISMIVGMVVGVVICMVICMVIGGRFCYVVFVFKWSNFVSGVVMS